MKGNGLYEKEVSKYITTGDEVKMCDDFSNLLDPINPNLLMSDLNVKKNIAKFLLHNSKEYNKEY